MGDTQTPRELSNSPISIESVKKWLKAMDFAPVDGSRGKWAKHYSKHQHTISLSTNGTCAECHIDYGRVIQSRMGRATTCNLAQLESLVVLECVNRLLDLGYPPAAIVLEKSYPLGHTSGYLDILVLQNDGAYFMVECKCWGQEFTKERARLFADGGQLFSYYHQDRSARFIALYSARLQADKIECSYCAVDTSVLKGDSVPELFQGWDKSYFESGAFKGEPYEIQETRLVKSDLQDMTADDGGKIFNDFAEILRRYVVSDKPNAFNKMFNLFICKVQDEEKQDNETLDFQWQAGESAESVLNRLNDLYKSGMSQYLEVEIADHSPDEIDKRLNAAATKADRALLHQMITELRLYKSNEFAFKEVFDKKTFDANAEVVREVVRLLQRKRLRYTYKQQFLGDFFERLLNTSVKQEAGQFFTPIPVARFICDSLPLQAIVDAKIQGNDANFLPYVIDYASGSGHFLTESMDRIDHIVKAIDDKSLRTTQRNNLDRWREHYAWADEFVYGIEKDYRLAKTAKVSCFLNGDGEAHVICADGLDHFADSEEYKGRLLNKALSDEQQDNPRFDVLVANPPYSVAAFKKTVKHGERSFSLWSRLTEKSSEIECLFVERAKQLLKPGAVAGIVLPSSILSNGGIYEAARELLLKYFEVKSLALLGTGTFMATGTNTVIVFLRRRGDDTWRRVNGFVHDFFSSWRDMTVAGQENAFDCYTRAVWGLSVDEYSELLRGDRDDPEHRLLTDFRESFERLTETRNLRASKSFCDMPEVVQQQQLRNRFTAWMQEQEKTKLLYYLLAYGQTVVLAKAPGGNVAEKTFLGYEFSSRKGSEGLQYLSGTGRIESALFNPDNDADNSKINTLIRSNFLGEIPAVPEKLSEYVTVTSLLSLMNFGNAEFNKSIGTTVKKSEIAAGRQ